MKHKEWRQGHKTVLDGEGEERAKERAEAKQARMADAHELGRRHGGVKAA